MSFGAWPAGVALAGLAALAGLLFVLQQLRTRYRDVTVVTTLFWKQVSHDAPVRTLRERFRHPLAYLLVLAIAACVWLALGDPRWRGDVGGDYHVIVVDGSAAMGSGNRLPASLAEARAIVARLPQAQREVVWAGATLRPLLAAGEDALLFDQRVAGIAADAAPPSVAQAVRQAAAVRRGTGPTRVVVAGDAPVGRDVLDQLPNDVTVTRASDVPAAGANAGITALGVSDAASGAWDAVDVYLAIERRPGTPRGDVAVTLDGRPVPAEAMRRTAATDGRGEAVLIHDLPAAGGLLEAHLPGNAGNAGNAGNSGDAIAADDVAAVRLPRKPRVRVFVSPSLLPTLKPVLDADNGVEIVDAKPDVVIRRAGESSDVAGRALDFVDMAGQPSAFLLTHPASADADAALTSAVDRLGLREIDAMSLAEQAGRPIGVSVAEGREWRFSVWAPLLTDEFNFTRSRAFPLFVASAVRWLAGIEAWAPYVAAGRPLRRTGGAAAFVLLGASGRPIDAVGLPFVPAAAGTLPREGGQPLAASLLASTVTTGGVTDALPVGAGITSAAGGPGLMTWLVLAALLLLAIEWSLLQRGRVP